MLTYPGEVSACTITHPFPYCNFSKNHLQIQVFPDRQDAGKKSIVSNVARQLIDLGVGGGA
ncbi:hypothetical protein GFER_03750 [Geoalkalibacter ferrihydriticus DSM 17813]|uniref:Uncharacterized protein n=1 Tax=Geoalkalibacter ferrihydriticus DSM 17813 TaxID=1121915 RepID=A0A0C2EGK9_9BACT|nr:hypothetical protein [Geoalkalibacter ferrihydriticus]KIH77773.1 hypothetical protein GFER_03750 [Geoalkalibacter ferrihydriticus DSM 17813]